MPTTIPMPTTRPSTSDDGLRLMLGAIAAKQYRGADTRTQAVIAEQVSELKARWPRLTTNAALAAICAASIHISPGG